MRFIKLVTALLTTLSLSHLSYADTTKAPDWSLSQCPAPVIDTRKTIALDTARVEDVHFKGCNGSSINAYLVSPLKPQLKKRPAILYVHWYEPHSSNSNRDEFLAEAKRMAQQGVVSLLVSSFWSIPGGHYQERRWQDDYQNTLNQTQNLLHSVNLLRAFPSVDKTRIAYVGHDYGASFGAIVAGIDAHINAFVLTAGAPRITEWYMYGSASGVPGDQSSAFLDSFKTIEPAAMLAKTKSKVLLQFGLRDQYISNQRAEEMHRAAPRNAVFKRYDTTHDMSLPKIEQDRRDWLTRVLKLQPPKSTKHK